MIGSACDVGEFDLLQGAQERGQREAAEGGGEDQVEWPCRRCTASALADRQRRHCRRDRRRWCSGCTVARWSGRCAESACCRTACGVPRSYLRPSLRRSVRSTKMIFAWIATVGVRMSRPRDEVDDRLDAGARIGDDQRVAGGIGNDLAAVLGDHARHGIRHLVGADVVQAHLTRLERARWNRAG